MTLLPAITKLMKVVKKAAGVIRYISKSSICLRADLGFGKMPLRRSQLGWAAEVLRAFCEGSRAAEARHLVFSLPKGTPRRPAIKLLFELFDDWRATYAPDRTWVAGIHFHEGRYHLHAAIANVGADGKPLKFKPHQVVAMSEMAFTDKAASAKGKGKKGLPIYSKARKKLAVEDLAEQLVADDGSMRDDQWERLKTEGVISNFRTRKKDGATTSFEFEGRRIRIRTLRAFVSEKQNTTKGTTMPIATVNPSQPLPDSLAVKLTAAGFSKKALDSLNSQLGAAHAASVPELKPKTKTLNRDTPKR